MKVISSKLSVSSRGHTDMIDITGEVREAVSKSKISHGTATVFVVGSTAGITTIEFEPGLVKDLKAAFQKFAPDNIPYAHHQKWGDDNGHSHVRASLLGPSLTVPVIGADITLGTWQQIILIDFDTQPRERTVVVQVTGEP